MRGWLRASQRLQQRTALVSCGGVVQCAPGRAEAETPWSNMAAIYIDLTARAMYVMPVAACWGSKQHLGGGYVAHTSCSAMQLA